MKKNEQIELTARLRDIAREHGFPSLRISDVNTVTADAEIAVDRISQDKFSGLQWFTKERVLLASNPKQLLPNAQSMLTFAVNYFDPDSEASRDPHRGQIARYAVGKDYHRSLKRRLSKFMDAVQEASGYAPEYRIFVDDSPLLERAFARQSGLGWIGKNTNLLVPGNGSWVFLAEIVTSLELIIDQPVKKTCGSCQRCIDVCPTGAISAAYEVENDLCISFLTIENRGPIPLHLRNPIGTWIFGCDLCQEFCPVNRLPEKVSFDEFRMREEMGQFDMREILSMTEEAFNNRFQGTPIMRAKYTGMQRNVCVALGNIGSSDDVSVLVETLGNPSPLVRGHAAWALGQIAGSEALTALKSYLAIEEDSSVRSEVTAALEIAL